MKRADAITLIAADVAENGKLTHLGVRIYVENPISRDVLNAAVRRGLAVYEAKQKAGAA